MNFNSDDPKWTAYVLGELGDQERVEIERILQTSEEARALVDELRIAITLMKDEFAFQDHDTLHSEQREAVLAAARPARRQWFGERRLIWAGGLAAAALVITTSVMIPSLLRSRQAAVNLSSAAMDSASQPGAVGGVLKEPIVPPAPARVPDSEQSKIMPAPVPQQPAKQAGALVVDGAGGDPLVRGTVTDSSGAVLPGVQVTVSNKSTGDKETTISGQTGQFEVRGIAPGDVQVEASLPGFRTARAEGVRIDSNQIAQFNPKLEVGSVAEQAEVNAAPNPAPASSPPNPGALSRGNVATQDRVLSEAASQERAAVASNFGEALRDRLADRRQEPASNTEAYDRITDNPFIRVRQDPLATFSIDVDTASYANVRRFLSSQYQLPPKDSVRIEELINYFTYDYPQPSGQHPIGVNMEVASAPWNPEHRLVRIGIKGKDIDLNRRPSSNLVFLIDVSGSMQPPEKLPLLKSAMKLLVDNLTENDRVSIVVYAGASGLVLPPTTGDRKDTIIRALDNLYAGGSTNGASGIQLAYNLAGANFLNGGINRVVLATDGDFNVGITNQGDLIRLIEEKAKSGVFLSVLGFGMGNLKDSTLEKLADTGNGNYAYIDSLNEARKVLVEQMGGTLVTIAKDVKLQIEFNPGQVEAYRLIGYENRLLRNEDFNNDQKDAGDMGAGHTVTALFEIVPRGGAVPAPGVDSLKYQTPPEPAARTSSREMLTLKVRYKDPEASQSKLIDVALADQGRSFSGASRDFRFAASVAAFGMILRNSPYKGSAGFDTVAQIAEANKGPDRNGYREEFIRLVRQARAIGDRNR